MRVQISYRRSFWRHHPESNRGIKVLQTSALPLGYGAGLWAAPTVGFGAGDGARTRHLCLGKAALYRMSYSRGNGASEWSRTTDTGIFSPLLYQLSYRGRLATRRGLEPLTSSVTGWHSNQLNYRAVCTGAAFCPVRMVGTTGLEPVTPCL